MSFLREVSVSIIVSWIFLQVVSSKPVATEKDAKRFLEKYSYFDQTDNGVANQLLFRSSTDKFKEAIRKFQSFTSLTTTGELDSETLKEMNKPRCGVADITPANRVRTKRNLHPQNYSLTGSKWSRTNITYTVTKYSNKYPKRWIDKDIAKAFEAWSRISPLTFEKTNDGKADIEMSFSKGDHGDEDPFDGQGGILAHAFGPENGDVHYDDDEKFYFTFSKEKLYRVDFYYVTLHELGHSLGLGHSDVKGAVMYPSHERLTDKVAFHEDDIKAMKELYGDSENEV